MQVWNMLHAACWKCRTQKSPKNRHLGTIAQLCQAVSSQLRHVSTIGKKLGKQQCLSHMSSQYGELRPTSGWDMLASFGHHVGHWPTFPVIIAIVIITSARRWARATWRAPTEDLTEFNRTFYCGEDSLCRLIWTISCASCAYSKQFLFKTINWCASYYVIRQFIQIISANIL